MPRSVNNGLSTTDPGFGGGGGGAIPSGVILDFAGPLGNVPAGYLPCDGSVVLQATYPDLFAAIGTSWNTGGELGTEFRLPDFRGRSSVSLNDAGLPNGLNGSFSARALADVGGTETHSHGGATGSAGGHSHGIPNDGNHNHAIPGDGSHSHGGATGTEQAFGSGGGGAPGGGNAELLFTSGDSDHRHSISGDGSHSHGGATGFNGSHSHGGTNGVGNHSHSIGSDGTLHPFAVTIKIIAL